LPIGRCPFRFGRGAPKKRNGRIHSVSKSEQQANSLVPTYYTQISALHNKLFAFLARGLAAALGSYPRLDSFFSTMGDEALRQSALDRPKPAGAAGGR
jgi:hypothetical protein